jgi:hypothetical protein
MALSKNQIGTNAMTATESSSGCLVEGDMMFTPGQPYGPIIGSLCYDKSTYLGKQKICGTSGSMIDVENNFTCPSDSPNCVQCSDNLAICVSDVTTVTDECDSGNGGSGFGCLVEGDMMFTPGQPYGPIIGSLCYDKSTYLGKQKICGTSGSMIDVENNFTCPSDSPNCVQCSDNLAICMSDVTTVTDECDSANGGSITTYPPVMNITSEFSATFISSSALARKASNLSSRLIPTIFLLSLLV